MLWGKLASYFQGREKENVIRAIVDADPNVVLHTVLPASEFSAAQNPALSHPAVVREQFLSREQWRELLAQASFFVGLGDPLMGPSALEAVQAGAVFLNPTYPTPREQGQYTSQHPYLARSVGEPYVCSYPQGDTAAVRRCMQAILARPSKLPPMQIEAMARRPYLLRLRAILEPVPPAPGA